MGTSRKGIGKIVNLDMGVDNRRDGFIRCLEENILHSIYRCGEKIPSERHLGEAYGLSRPTVREGIQILLDRGILERRGRGAHVTAAAMELLETPMVPVGKITAIFNFYAYENAILRTVFDEIFRQLGKSIAVEVMVTEANDRAIAAKIDPASVAVVFGGGYLVDCYPAIHDRCRNMFLVNGVAECCNWILPDNYAAGWMMAELLYRRGHQAIGVSYQTSQAQEFTERYEGARDFLRERHVELLFTRVPRMYYDHDVEAVFLEQYYVRDKATAIIGLRDLSSLHLYDLARERNISIPKDLSIISFDDRFCGALVNPPLTTVRYPARLIAVKLSEALTRAFTRPAGEILLRERIMPVLLERGSVRNLK